MRFLNPKTDYAFKKIFGSDASRDILISFLNAVLGLDGAEAIVEVAILDPYQVPRIKGWKDSFVDVRARDERGRSFIVEMQVLVSHGFEKRVLFNACKAYVGQIGSTEDYGKLVGVIAITITDFVMYPGLQDVVSSFRLRAAENPDIVHQDMELVFVELPKFEKEEARLETALDRWLYFLRTAGQLEAVPGTLSSDPAIDHALQIASKAGMSAEELDELERREQWLGMQKNLLVGEEEARRQGLAQGLAEGQARGKSAALVRLLECRFGPLPAGLPDTITKAGPDTVEAWFDRAIDADSLAKVFAGSSDA